ncbi:MAG: methyltransferase [Gammaproteobacteria bacterium]|nr:methyltransferase [Gammaproteobacteria bacterium]
MDENEPAERPDPKPLMELTTAYWGSQTLLTANRIGLFEHLGHGPADAAAIADALGIRPRETGLLLKACVALGLLVESSHGFENSLLSDTYLVPGSPGYLGNAIRYSDDLYSTWGNLEQVLREAGPSMPTAEYTGGDPERTRHFVYGMHNRALGIGGAMIGMVDLTGRARMLDVGGGPGTYSALFARQYPKLRSQVMDLPEVAVVAREIVASMGLSDRVVPVAGDYSMEDFPPGNDVVLISGVMHRESENGCRKLVEKARDGLNSGGMLVISDVLTDNGGASPLFATLFGLNMMLTAPNGGVHSDFQVAGWMQEAGFLDVVIKPFPPPMPHRLLTGVVP